jgi:hypothetical protein
MDAATYNNQPEQPMRSVTAPLVYAVGLDPLMARAIHADLAWCQIRSRPSLIMAGAGDSGCRRPDVLLIDLGGVESERELAAATRAWGENLLVVGLDRASPFARVWQRPHLAEVIEVGPGFLGPFLDHTGELAC